MQVDIAIVGAGFTGLWTAHSLLNADPTLRVAILEREQVGYGASGRNGGWCSALFPTSWTRLVKAGGVSGARAMHAAMVDTVTEVGRVCADEAIEADFAHGGTIVLARSAAQLQRAGEEVATAQERGQSGLQLLDQSQALDVVNATSVLGATYTPNCAAVHPL
ncbi:MAG TPA: FAD-dependent oxidoreductase, partial [Marmoricola sp.]|nr:FAD-dependent oxidoreductase [Marmoricola sp.]